MCSQRGAYLQRTVVVSYNAEHYNRARPHRALALAPPLAEAGDPIPVSPRDVRRRDLLGGLIHEYHGLAQSGVTRARAARAGTDTTWQ